MDDSLQALKNEKEPVQVRITNQPSPHSHPSGWASRLLGALFIAVAVKEGAGEIAQVIERQTHAIENQTEAIQEQTRAVQSLKH